MERLTPWISSNGSLASPPDAGTGATEAALLIGLAMVVFYLVKRRPSAFTPGRRIDR
jgi:hypothetical protein